MRPLSRHFCTGSAVALLFIAGMAARPASAQIVTNGGFETPVLGSGFSTYGPGGEPAGFGWSILAGNLDHIDESFWQGNPGQSIDMNGTSPVTIAQTLSVVSGSTYQLTFSMAGNPDGGPTIKTLEVFWGGASQGTFTFDITGDSRENMGWVTNQLTLVAPSNATELRFQSLTLNSSAGPALDSVSVVQVSGVVAPEPGTIALLGFTALPVAGAILRRRRSASR